MKLSSDNHRGFRYSSAFSAPESRRIRVLFYTSNVNKYLQARYVMSRFGFVIEHFRGTTPYAEDYSVGKEKLLEQAILEIIERERDVVFFLEDTSLRIDAFSSTSLDVPGLAVKEWFQGITFEQLDQQLRNKGNNRAATIESGIALHLPGRSRPVFFFGESVGQVANVASDFRTSSIHPWLNSRTFDGWFIPDGTHKRLGQMSADESMRWHFRSRALVLLAERLVEYTAVVNLPPRSIFVRRKRYHKGQKNLFRDKNPILVVCGERASGKTMIGDYLSNKYGFDHFEASMVVRKYFRELGETDQSLDEFATGFHMQMGDDIVASSLSDEFGLTDSPKAVVTGFRKLEELRYLEDNHIEYKIVFVISNDRSRFDRYLDRGRDPSPVSFQDFVEMDHEHSHFYQFAGSFADVLIENKYDFDHFLTQITYLVEDVANDRPQGIRLPALSTEPPVLLLVLRALSSTGEWMTAKKINISLGSDGHAVSTRAVDKALSTTRSLCEKRFDEFGTPQYKAGPHARSFADLGILRIKNREHLNR